jgi:hypothetical protein
LLTAAAADAGQRLVGTVAGIAEWIAERRCADLVKKIPLFVG